MSPAAGMPAVSQMHRQNTDFAYMAMNVPPHLRNEMPQHSPRSSPSLSQAYSNPVNGHSRPSLTSHPNAYGPPSVLEPPAQTQPGSANGSPHMGPIGWQSPSQAALPSPSAGDGYGYADAPYNNSQQNLYYQNSNLRRTNSTEPDQYELRQWAPPVQ